MAYINEPNRIPLPIKLMIYISEKTVGKTLKPARLLAWYPKAAISSGILEVLIAHKIPGISKRMLKLIRMQTSFIASCPFCIDMNSSEYEQLNITNDEIRAMQGKHPISDISTFTKREKLILYYTRAITRSPIRMKPELVSSMKKAFTPKQIVVIVSTIAQVNYWTRLIQGLGINPVGFTASCEILDLEAYKTYKN